MTARRDLPDFHAATRGHERRMLRSIRGNPAGYRCECGWSGASKNAHAQHLYDVWKGRRDAT